MRKKSIGMNLFMIIVSLMAIFPFYLMLIMSSYTSEQIYKGISLLPGSAFLKNAKTVFESNYLLYYRNSIIVSTCTVLLQLLVSTMAGYALSKFKFAAAGPIMTTIIGLMVIPHNVSLVAFVMEMKSLGWINTWLPLIIPCASPFGVFWMASSIKEAVPDELIEAAQIDGCSQFYIFFKIVVPLARSAIGTLALLVFLSSWNNVMTPLVTLSDPKLFTLPLGIKAFGTSKSTDYGAQIFGLSLAVIPIAAVFAIFSKNLIRGITSGAVKE